VNTRAVTVALWIGVFAAAVSDLRLLRTSTAVGVDDVFITAPDLMGDHAMSPDSASRLATLVTDADPFRVDRHPSSVPFRAAQAEPAAATPQPVRPALTLSGIVGGPPWAAVVSGVPGHSESVIVHAGDTVGGLRIGFVTARSMLVSGMDTVWRLHIQQPWR